MMLWHLNRPAHKRPGHKWTGAQTPAPNRLHINVFNRPFRMPLKF